MIHHVIMNVVISGELKPCVQAGDLDIEKSYKDKIIPLIAAWEKSFQVKRTACTNKKAVF